MTMIDNIFSQLPSPKVTSFGARSTAENEQFSDLLKHPGLHIERIVSTGQTSPPDFWYDQPTNEWVLLVQGEAKLRFADESEARNLKAGDYLEITAHRKHRVDWTPSGEITIWLAIHY